MAKEKVMSEKTWKINSRKSQKDQGTIPANRKKEISFLFSVGE